MTKPIIGSSHQPLPPTNSTSVTPGARTPSSISTCSMESWMPRRMNSVLALPAIPAPLISLLSEARIVVHTGFSIGLIQGLDYEESTLELSAGAGSTSTPTAFLRPPTVRTILSGMSGCSLS